MRLRRAILLVVAVLVAGGLPGAPVSAAPPQADTTVIAPPTNLTTTTVITTARGRRLAVGDSLMVGVASRMRRRGFAVNARVGRQFSTGPGIVRSYGSRLPRNVVIELGTNGTVRLSDCRAIVRTAGPRRRVFLVNNRVPRSWQRPNNRTLLACDRSFRSSRVRIINWYRASAGHPEWFTRDRVHLTSSGQRAFVRLIDHAVDSRGL